MHDYPRRPARRHASHRRQRCAARTAWATRCRKPARPARQHHASRGCAAGPELGSTASVAAPLAPPDTSRKPRPPQPTPGPPVHVVTDVLDLDINLKGGELDRADLLQYPVHKDTPKIPVRLLNSDPRATWYLLQTGLAGAPGEAAPSTW